MTDIQTGIPLYVVGDQIKIVHTGVLSGVAAGIDLKRLGITYDDVLTVTRVECDPDGYVFIHAISKNGRRIGGWVQERFVKVDENGNDI